MMPLLEIYSDRIGSYDFCVLCKARKSLKFFKLFQPTPLAKLWGMSCLHLRVDFELQKPSQSLADTLPYHFLQPALLLQE